MRIVASFNEAEHSYQMLFIPLVSLEPGSAKVDDTLCPMITVFVAKMTTSGNRCSCPFMGFPS